MRPSQARHGSIHNHFNADGPHPQKRSRIIASPIWPVAQTCAA
jgi:hypothetical protein